MTCYGCGADISNAVRSDARYCSSACRQRAFRERSRVLSSENVERVIAAGDLSPVMVQLLREAVTARSAFSRNAKES